MLLKILDELNINILLYVTIIPIKIKIPTKFINFPVFLF